MSFILEMNSEILNLSRVLKLIKHSTPHQKAIYNAYKVFGHLIIYLEFFFIYLLYFF